jgi:hypothetical protein
VSLIIISSSSSITVDLFYFYEEVTIEVYNLCKNILYDITSKIKFYNIIVYENKYFHVLPKFIITHNFRIYRH